MVNECLETICHTKLSFSSNQEKGNTIGIIGLGRIGEALLYKFTEQVNGNNIKIKGITLYYRDFKDDEKRAVGLINQLAPVVDRKFNIGATSKLDELGTSDIIIIIIGREQVELQKSRRGLTGEYFKDIKEIMYGLGSESTSTILMATNPVTPNCFVSDYYSLKDNLNIIGFTRLDNLRAIHLLKNWLEEEEKTDLRNLNISLNIIGPHGYDMIITNIRVGNKGPIYSNEDLLRELNFRNKQKTLEKLSSEISRYGERTFKNMGLLSSPYFFASQLANTIYLILNGGRDTAAIRVNLNDICSSNLDFSDKTYIGLPVIYNKGIPSIDNDLDINRIPIRYRQLLLKTLKRERERIIKHLN